MAVVVCVVVDGVEVGVVVAIDFVVHFTVVIAGAEIKCVKNFD